MFPKGNQLRKGLKPANAFQKGFTPWNKGLKGIHLSPKSEWKKGHISLSKDKIGSITQRKDKTGKIRNWIKIKEPNKWEYYSRYLWKEKYGFIIKEDVVHHLNGNTLDDRIENLIALSRKDHPIFHNRWRLTKLTKKQLDFYKNRY